MAKQRDLYEMHPDEAGRMDLSLKGPGLREMVPQVPARVRDDRALYDLLVSIVDRRLRERDQAEASLQQAEGLVHRMFPDGAPAGEPWFKAGVERDLRAQTKARRRAARQPSTQPERQVDEDLGF